MAPCCVMRCRSSKKPGTRFYAIPMDRTQRQKWLLTMQIPRNRVSDSSKLCEWHFHKSDFIQGDQTRPNVRRKLRKQTMPDPELEARLWNKDPYILEKEAVKGKSSIVVNTNGNFTMECEDDVNDISIYSNVDKSISLKEQEKSILKEDEVKEDEPGHVTMAKDVSIYVSNDVQTNESMNVSKDVSSNGPMEPMETEENTSNPVTSLLDIEESNEESTTSSKDVENITFDKAEPVLINLDEESPNEDRKLGSKSNIDAQKRLERNSFSTGSENSAERIITRSRAKSIESISPDVTSDSSEGIEWNKFRRKTLPANPERSMPVPPMPPLVPMHYRSVLKKRPIVNSEGNFIFTASKVEDGKIRINRMLSPNPKPQKIFITRKAPYPAFKLLPDGREVLVTNNLTKRLYPPNWTIANALRKSKVVDMSADFRGFDNEQSMDSEPEIIDEIVHKKLKCEKVKTKPLVTEIETKLEVPETILPATGESYALPGRLMVNAKVSLEKMAAFIQHLAPDWFVKVTTSINVFKISTSNYGPAINVAVVLDPHDVFVKVKGIRLASDHPMWNSLKTLRLMPGDFFRAVTVLEIIKYLNNCNVCERDHVAGCELLVAPPSKLCSYRGIASSGVPSKYSSVSKAHISPARAAPKPNEVSTIKSNKKAENKHVKNCRKETRQHLIRKSVDSSTSRETSPKAETINYNPKRTLLPPKPQKAIEQSRLELLRMSIAQLKESNSQTAGEAIVPANKATKSQQLFRTIRSQLTTLINKLEDEGQTTKTFTTQEEFLLAFQLRPSIMEVKPSDSRRKSKRERKKDGVPQEEEDRLKEVMEMRFLMTNWDHIVDLFCIESPSAQKTQISSVTMKKRVLRCEEIINLWHRLIEESATFLLDINIDYVSCEDINALPLEQLRERLSSCARQITSIKNTLKSICPIFRNLLKQNQLNQLPGL